MTVPPLKRPDSDSVEPAQPVRIVSTQWSAVSPGLFDDIARELMDDWAESLDIERVDLPITLTQVKAVLREFGNAYRDTQQKGNGLFPQFYSQVRDDPEIWSRLTRKVTGADLLPEVFRVGEVVYENRPELGIAPVVTTNVNQALTRGIFPFDAVTKFFNNVDDVSIRNPELAAEEVRLPTVPGVEGEPSKSIDFGQFTGVEDEFRALVGRGLINLRNNIPEEDDFDLSRYTGFNQEDSEPSGSGRGRLSFDRAALTQNASATWGQILWEAPPGGIVDEYISSANSLWQSSGVQQGFGTWLQGKMQQTGKYGVMYGRMEPGFTELEWQARFNTAQFGLRLEDERAQSLRGLSSGAAPASFQQSVEQSRDVQALGQGRFSQRFANHINQLGSLQKV